MLSGNPSSKRGAAYVICVCGRQRAYASSMDAYAQSSAGVRLGNRVCGDAEKRGADYGDDIARQPINAQERQHDVGKVEAHAENIGVGKIDEPDDSIYHCITNGNKCIHSTCTQSIDDLR